MAEHASVVVSGIAERQTARRPYVGNLDSVTSRARDSQIELFEPDLVSRLDVHLPGTRPCLQRERTRRHGSDELICVTRTPTTTITHTATTMPASTGITPASIRRRR